MAFYKAKKITVNGRTSYIPGAWLVNKTPADVKLVADRIEKLCTVHYADIKAVLAVLPEVMAQLMNEGRSVHLQDLGTFRYTIDVKPGAGKATAEEVGNDDILKTNIVFHPETTYAKQGNAQTRALAPNSTEWIKLEGVIPVADATPDTPTTETPSVDTEQTGGDTENPYDPFAS